MFRRLHIQMTVFSTLITSSILILMTLACLLIAENGTRKNVYTSFKNNAASCISQLEAQREISYAWVLKSEKAYGIRMDIRDNGSPLYFRKLASFGDIEAPLEKAAEISRETFALDLDNPGSVSVITKQAYFEMEEYYAATALIPKEHGTLSVIFLCSLTALERQLKTQRLAFAGAVLLAILALAVFSWLFTGKMLRPLEENHKRQTEFIAAASHELRSPLAVILSGISALKDADAKDRDRFLSVLQTEGTRMSRLVNDLLSLAGADNGSWSLFPARCEPDTLLLDTYEKYEPLMAEKELRFSVELPEEAAGDCLWDSARVSQVLGILLDNAMSYTPAGGTVRLSLREEERKFLISVSDSGPGIPDKQKDAVFRRFYRADSSRNDKQHFGLGLSIAREIVALHKGSICVSDAPGGGAVFTVSLPK